MSNIKYFDSKRITNEEEVVHMNKSQKITSAKTILTSLHCKNQKANKRIQVLLEMQANQSQAKRIGGATIFLTRAIPGIGLCFFGMTGDRATMGPEMELDFTRLFFEQRSKSMHSVPAPSRQPGLNFGGLTFSDKEQGVAIQKFITKKKSRLRSEYQGADKAEKLVRALRGFARHLDPLVENLEAGGETKEYANTFRHFELPSGSYDSQYHDFDQTKYDPEFLKIALTLAKQHDIIPIELLRVCKVAAAELFEEAGLHMSLSEICQHFVGFFKPLQRPGKEAQYNGAFLVPVTEKQARQMLLEQKNRCVNGDHRWLCPVNWAYELEIPPECYLSPRQIVQRNSLRSALAYGVRAARPYGQNPEISQDLKVLQKMEKEHNAAKKNWSAKKKSKYETFAWRWMPLQVFQEKLDVLDDYTKKGIARVDKYPAQFRELCEILSAQALRNLKKLGLRRESMLESSALVVNEVQPPPRRRCNAKVTSYLADMYAGLVIESCLADGVDRYGLNFKTTPGYNYTKLNTAMVAYLAGKPLKKCKGRVAFFHDGSREEQTPYGYMHHVEKDGGGASKSAEPSSETVSSILVTKGGDNDVDDQLLYRMMSQQMGLDVVAMHVFASQCANRVITCDNGDYHREEMKMAAQVWINMHDYFENVVISGPVSDMVLEIVRLMKPQNVFWCLAHKATTGEDFVGSNANAKTKKYPPDKLRFGGRNITVNTKTLAAELHQRGCNQFQCLPQRNARAFSVYVEFLNPQSRPVTKNYAKSQRGNTGAWSDLKFEWTQASGLERPASNQLDFDKSGGESKSVNV